MEPHAFGQFDQRLIRTARSVFKRRLFHYLGLYFVVMGFLQVGVHIGSQGFWHMALLGAILMVYARALKLIAKLSEDVKL